MPPKIYSRQPLTVSDLPEALKGTDTIWVDIDSNDPAQQALLKDVFHFHPLAIEDTGMGIAGYELPYIFDRFYQGSRSRSRADSGSGLGLSIAKWIVEKHGGTIQADSEVGKGTQFAISLPLLAG